MQQLLDWLQDTLRLIEPMLLWLKEWQFLVGSLIAVFAAAIAVSAIDRQIREQRLEAKERRRRLARAFRASMPEDLHAICSYTRRCAEVGRQGIQIITAQEEGQTTRGRLNRLRCPVLPNYVLNNLKALIEHLDHENAEKVADLVGCYYNQHARVTGALENFDQSNSGAITVSNNINLNPVFKNTLELYLRAKGMLEFARGETENISGTFDNSEILSALRRLNIEHVMSPEAREHCLRFLSVEMRGESLGHPS